MDLILATIFAHVISDFVIQSSRTVEEKTRLKAKGFIKHFLEVFIPLFAILFIQYNFLDIILYVFVISLIHIIIDIIKILVQDKIPQKTNLFILDQIFHMSVVVFWVVLFNIKFIHNHYFNGFATVFANVSNRGLGKSVAAFMPQFELLGIIYVLFGIGAGIFIGSFLEPFKKDLGEEKSYIGAGRYIGIFERFIIITLTIMSQYGAIAFIIAAKSLARYEDLNKRGFAEYYLLGTLLSIIVAISGGLLVKYAIPIMN